MQLRILPIHIGGQFVATEENALPGSRVQQNADFWLMVHPVLIIALAALASVLIWIAFSAFGKVGLGVYLLLLLTSAVFVPLLLGLLVYQNYHVTHEGVWHGWPWQRRILSWSNVDEVMVHRPFGMLWNLWISGRKGSANAGFTKRRRRRKFLDAIEMHVPFKAPGWSEQRYPEYPHKNATRWRRAQE